MLSQAQSPRSVGKANIEIPHARLFLAIVWIIYLVAMFGNFRSQPPVDENLLKQKLLEKIVNGPDHSGGEIMKSKQAWVKPQVDPRIIESQRALESYMNRVELDILRRQEEATRRSQQEALRMQQLEEMKRQLTPPSPIPSPNPPPAAGDPRLMGYR